MRSRRIARAEVRRQSLSRRRVGVNSARGNLPQGVPRCVDDDASTVDDLSDRSTERPRCDDGDLLRPGSGDPIELDTVSWAGKSGLRPLGNRATYAGNCFPVGVSKLVFSGMFPFRKRTHTRD